MQLYDGGILMKLYDKGVFLIDGTEIIQDELLVSALEIKLILILRVRFEMENSMWIRAL